MSQTPFGLLTDWDEVAWYLDRAERAESQTPFGLLTDWDVACCNAGCDRVVHWSQTPFGLLTDWDAEWS